MSKTKTLFEAARNIPIAEVVERLGGELAESHKGASRKYRIDGRMIVVSPTGYGWFEVGGKAGAGAIDLVMLVHDCDNRTALNFLLDSPFASQKSSFPTRGFAVGDGFAGALAGAEGDGNAELKVIASPIPDPVAANWTRARTWLIDVRGLDARIIDDLHQEGTIYADSFANTIFIGRAGGNQGCELRGTSQKKFAGRRGGCGLFELKPESELSSAAAVESAIDAISLRMLGYKGRIVSTGGALGSNAIDYLKTLSVSQLAGFDADDAGDGYAHRLIESLPGTTRMRPSLDLKDWNDILLAGASFEKVTDMPFTDAELTAAGANTYFAKLKMT